MPQHPREQWGTRAGFLLAAIGSAVGLGNIWRFPYIAYENGGGAFLVPYLVALLTAGLPLLILCYAIGHRYRGSPPVALRRMARPAEAIGWWQVAICFVISVYYAVIIAWAASFVWFSIGQRWGDDPEAFFVEEYLRSAEEPGMISTYVPGVLAPLVLIWIVVLVVLAMGVRRGIERANKIFIPLLAVLFCALVVRALFLDGAALGLDAFFSPDWSGLARGRVWVAAYGQILFSLSVGFGIMITYASYLRRRADLSGSALVAGFANSSFEMLAGIGVFATLGYMVVVSPVATSVEEVVEAGPVLAFVAFPQIISAMPGGDIFGVVFFASLVLAGLSSLISIVQVVVAAVRDRTGMGRVPAVLAVGGATAVVSLVLFPTDMGLLALDVADHFVNEYGIVLAALVLVIVVAWVLRRLPDFQAHVDAISVVRLGWWWRLALGVVTPVMLVWMVTGNLRAELAENYEGLPTWFLLGGGWAVAAGALLFGVVMAWLLRNRDVGEAEDADVPARDEQTTERGQ